MNRLLAVAVAGLALAARASPVAAAETLTDAWSHAVGSNPQLAAVALEEAAAYQDVAAATTDRWPTAWVQGSYSVRSDQRNFRLANPFSPGQQFVAPYAQREAAGAAAGVTMPLYTGGEIANSVLGAEARAAAAAQGTALSRLQLLLAVGEAYLGVLRCQRDLEVANENLASHIAHQREAERQFEQRRTARNDVLAAQVATASAEQLRLRRVHLLTTAQGEYNRLLARPLGTPVELEELALASLAGPLEQLQCLAWQQRPDLAQLAAAADARRFDAERLRADARPHVSAVGQYDFEENRFQTPQAITSAGVVVDWSFFDAGKSRRAASAADMRAASLGRLADDLKAQIALDVQTAWNSAQEAQARLLVAERALVQADESLRVSTLRYEQGAALESEVLDAQARRTQAASDYFNAGYDLTLAQLRLRYAVGLLGAGP